MKFVAPDFRTRGQYLQIQPTPIRQGIGLVLRFGGIDDDGAQRISERARHGAMVLKFWGHDSKYGPKLWPQTHPMAPDSALPYRTLKSPAFLGTRGRARPQ